MIDWILTQWDVLWLRFCLWRMRPALHQIMEEQLGYRMDEIKFIDAMRTLFLKYIPKMEKMWYTTSGDTCYCFHVRLKRVTYHFDLEWQTEAV